MLRLALVISIALSLGAPPALARPSPLDRARQLIEQGNTASRAGDLITATGLYRDAVAVAPRWPAGYVALATAFSRAKRFANAIEVLQVGLRHAPGQPSLTVALALVYAEQGETLKALETLREQEARTPDEIDLQQTRVTVAMHAGRFGEALSAQRAVVRILEATAAPEAALTEALATADALSLLLGEADRVRARSACDRPSTALRRALSSCPSEGGPTP